MAERLDAVGDPRLREALLFVRSEERSVTADELAARTGVHRNVARGRLERLLAAGFLRAEFEPQRGRGGAGAGRPAKTYRVAPELAGVEFPRRHLETLVSLLAAGVPARRRYAVGVEFGRELARIGGAEPRRSCPEALAGVCAALHSLGYQATVDQLDSGHAVFTTSTCPLRPLVVAHPEASAIDRGMWVGLVEAAATIPAASLRCETSGCLDADGACRVELALREAA